LPIGRQLKAFDLKNNYSSLKVEKKIKIDMIIEIKNGHK